MTDIVHEYLSANKCLVKLPVDTDINVLRRFYLPHGLTVDDNDNIWITDLGSHQVHTHQ